MNLRKQIMIRKHIWLKLIKIMRPYPIRSLQNNSTILGNTRDGPLPEKGNLYIKKVSLM